VEKKVSELKKKLENSMKAEALFTSNVKKAANVLERTRQKLSALRESARDLFHPDGSSFGKRRNTSQVKLVKDLRVCEGHVKEAEKLLMIEKKKLGEVERKVNLIKKDLQLAFQLKSKKEALADEKDSDLTQAGSVIRIMNEVCNRRRVCYTSQNASSTFKDVTKSTPKTKQESSTGMERRRATNILRPTQSRILDEIKYMSASKFGKRHDDNDTSLEIEQLLLLSLHPWASPQLPSFPPSSSSFKEWAEPGWMVMLEVPNLKSKKSTILPRKGLRYHMFQQNYSEYSSSLGHQAASLHSSRHLRGLVGNLSTERKKTESHSAASQSLIENDFLSISHEEIEKNYKFQFPSAMQSQDKPVSSKRRSSSSASNKGSTCAPSSKRNKYSKAVLDSPKSSTTLHSAGSNKKTKTKDAAMLSKSNEPYMVASFRPTSEQQNKKKRLSGASIGSLQNGEHQNVANSLNDQLNRNTVQLQQYQRLSSSQLAQMNFVQNPQHQAQYAQQQAALENQSQLLQPLQFLPRPGQPPFTSMSSTVQSSCNNPKRTSISKESNHICPSPTHQMVTSVRNAAGNEVNNNAYLTLLQDGNNPLFQM